ncbi:hypothetical protein PH210_06480 [Paenibacillus sp. BSR1-1]|uniref:hypothetical protein n=1 Tax=Paenibacillus sp. BSR1-1 TaxID=3020845 RepID=UPI0025AF41F4|nr:hypothetical protein [Paenibacillus sp. BSR1-1]MDN3015853.1 hypothetical protein [Paenibacillus sp. BSR1-1]
MEYVYAETLKNEFKVLASFYTEQVRGEEFHCRNIAFVMQKGKQNIKRPDAFIILMNPGTSAPKGKKSTSPYLYLEAPSKLPLVEAKPDPTQYQIMRLMRLKGWNCVGILNLSDIRAGNSDDFKILLEKAELTGFHSHSIFSSTRVNELVSIINCSNGPIITAWGTNELLEPLANRALSILPSSRLKGLEHINKPFYYHINPILKVRQLEVLTKLHEMI